jgi:hypothetical protein
MVCPGEVVGTVGREEVVKRDRRMNMVQIMCIHVCKYKTIPVETVPGIGEGDERQQ